MESLRKTFVWLAIFALGVSFVVGIDEIWSAFGEIGIWVGVILIIFGVVGAIYGTLLILQRYFFRK